MKLILLLVGLVLVDTSVWASDKLTRDVVSGWGFSKSLKNKFKKHGYRVVAKKDGHPVRAGKKSIRFEVRPGDCGNNQGWNDCKKDRERHELTGSSKRYTMPSGEHWFGWSIYLPEDFTVIYPTKLALGQFHQKKGHPVWLFQNHNGGYWIDNQVNGRTFEKVEILNQSQMLGIWNDIAVHAKWTHKKDGFFRIYVNGSSTPNYEWNGPTKSKGKSVYFKFGIYRSFMQRWKNANNSSKVPAQVVYFDEVRRGNKRKDVSPK